MIRVRKATDRGHSEIGWLNSYHTFSFGDYYDASQSGFRDLLVINEDRVQPAKGFGTHGHRDMEIISYVLEGALEHKDSLGTGSLIRPGDVQIMSAGTGVRHSEFNGSPKELVHFLQIWILPDKEGLEPRYEQKAFSEQEKSNRLRLVASRDGAENSVTVHQDVKLYASVLAADAEVTHTLARGRMGWIQILRGAIEINGTRLGAGDGAALENEQSLKITAAGQKAELLLFDLA